MAPHGASKYHYDAANPSTNKFPPYYDNSVILGEFGQDTMREIKLDDQNRVFKINPFLDCGQVAGVGGATSAFEFECDNPMDMMFGKDGSFYLLTYGDGFFNINLDAGIYRWDYVKGQRAPKAVLTSDRTDGPAPLTVKFNGSGSSDSDPGDSIRYEWDFGDGSPISEEANPTHTYTKTGRFTAILSVIDSTGKKTSISTIITVGNTSPTVTVQAPIDGGLFSFGDLIQYKVTVTDPEDGTVNCNDVTVTFVLGHDTHGHAEQSATGCTGFLQSVAEDVSHGGNVFGVISASYTDKGGPGGVPTLSTTSQVQIRQKHQEVENVVTQSGTTTTSGTEGTTPIVWRSSLAQGDWLQLNGPFNLFGINTIAFRYADTAAGRTVGSPLAGIDVRQDSITGPVVGTVDLTSTGATGTWATATVPIAMTGKHELFLTFRAITGGATGGNLVNLNWVEFGGNGVTVQHTDVPGTVGGSVPATLSLTLGAPATFGAFTPGVAKEYTASTTATVISTAGDATLLGRRPELLRHGPSGQRHVLPAAAAAGPGCRQDLVRADLERGRPGHVQAGHRCQRRPPYGRLQQDADVHAVHHDSVSVTTAAAASAAAAGQFLTREGERMKAITRRACVAVAAAGVAALAASPAAHAQRPASVGEGAPTGQGSVQMFNYGGFIGSGAASPAAPAVARRPRPSWASTSPTRRTARAARRPRRRSAATAASTACSASSRARASPTSSCSVGPGFPANSDTAGLNSATARCWTRTTCTAPAGTAT